MCYRLRIWFVLAVVMAGPVRAQSPGAAEKRQATIEVQLPAEAHLEVDGERLKSTGAARTFKSPLLAPGRYSYTFTATYQGREVLRKVAFQAGERVRVDLRPDFQVATRPAAAVIPRPPEERSGSEKPEVVSLWSRLGGEEKVARVVDDWIDQAAQNRGVDFDRSGKHRLSAKAVVRLKGQLVHFISSVSDGPHKYTGQSMKETHKGMRITSREFEALLADLQKALAKNGVKPADADALLKAVRGLHDQIVEAGVGREKK
jgi:hemoglobin